MDIDNIGYLLIKPSIHTPHGGLETQLEVRPFILGREGSGRWQVAGLGQVWSAFTAANGRSWLAGPGLECLHSSHW